MWAPLSCHVSAASGRQVRTGLSIFSLVKMVERRHSAFLSDATEREDIPITRAKQTPGMIGRHL